MAHLLYEATATEIFLFSFPCNVLHAFLFVRGMFLLQSKNNKCKTLVMPDDPINWKARPPLPLIVP